MLSINKFNNVYWKSAALIAFACFMFLITPEMGLAASTAQVQSKLKSAATAIQGVLTGIVAIIAIVAALKIIIKHLPEIDDPHVKNEMWKSLAGVLYATGAAAAVIWLVPWIYSLLK
ncbi:CagC family type IV secretion system protein [Lederbergia lenta]|uniref:CagC family type IV secretion system protein n=1 Tax=Lederbergia lenta TaxID=1467 RepID=UPI002040A583|nr:CagC family type IV secretion system protein [Lederbergia lenta]MCM3113651.1 CagC family type IV secretion system protein [Lederbergia lenta]